MHDKTLTEHLGFLVTQKGQDEATVLAQALRAGIEALYQETLTEAYLLGACRLRRRCHRHPVRVPLRGSFRTPTWDMSPRSRPKR